MSETYYRPRSTAYLALTCKCPNCGTGPLFSGFLDIVSNCSVCKQDLSQSDAGDGPAVFVILIAGLVIVAGALYVEVNFQPPYWLHAMIWLPLGLALPLALLRPVKAWLSIKQFQKQAHLGRLDLDEH